VADTQMDVLESQQADIVAFLQHLAAQILGSDVRIDSWTLSLSGAARKRPFSLSAVAGAAARTAVADDVRPFRAVTALHGGFRISDRPDGAAQ
jgi:hypothetical protein